MSVTDAQVRLHASSQGNGQRKLGGPPDGWEGAAPERGCEVFVGKLPRQLSEERLVGFLSTVGSVYEVRLMLDFSGANRGYCFVVYGRREEAARACRELNNAEVVAGRRVGVVKSVDNRRLFVGGIPRDRTRAQVKTELSKLTDDVVDVILYQSSADKSKNRGFAFVEYVSHQAAAQARRKLVPTRVHLWGQPVCVDWAEPEQDVDEDTMANVKIVYVRNLMLSTSEALIRKQFEQISADGVQRVKKIKDYAFVHFAKRQDALAAIEKLNGTLIDGSAVEVVLAKPPDRSIMRYVKNAQKLGGQSLPPAPTVHQSIVAAASYMYAAAAGARAPVAVPPGQLTPPTDSSSPPTPPDVVAPPLPVDSLAWAVTGAPLVDSAVIANDRFTCTEVPPTRGSAGMRSAGFQSFVSNQLRKNRRRYADTAVYYNPFAYPMPQTAPYQQGMLAGQFVFVPAFAPAFVPPGVLPQWASAPPHSPTDLSSLPTAPPSFVEQLEEHCQREGWGAPQFELTSLIGRDAQGRNSQLYLCKVSVPSLTERYGVFQPQQAQPSAEEATAHAALVALLQLGIFATAVAPPHADAPL